MYTTIRQYQADQRSIHEILRQDKLTFMPAIKKAKGFREYTCIDSGRGTVTSISVFEDRLASERFDSDVQEWVKQHMGSLLPDSPYVISGVIEHHIEGKVPTS
ncbi:MAG TPA: hypothetical protein VIO57_12585 [Chloroflexota bacterium]|jgi:hypothetical protein